MSAPESSSPAQPAPSNLDQHADALLEATVSAFEAQLSSPEAKASEFVAALALLRDTGHLERLSAGQPDDGQPTSSLDERLNALTVTMVRELSSRVTAGETISGSILGVSRQLLSALGKLSEVRADIEGYAPADGMSLPRGITQEDLDSLPPFDGVHSRVPL